MSHRPMAPDDAVVEHPSEGGVHEEGSPKTSASTERLLETADAVDDSQGRVALLGEDRICRASLEELHRSVPDYLLAPPEYSVSSTVKATFEKFCEIHSRGRRLNVDIHKNRRISNPYFVANTLQRYGIDQGSSQIHSCKRQRTLECGEDDSIHALRAHRKQQKQPSYPMDAEGEQGRLDGGPVPVDHMAARRQEAISQFVIDAKQRLQRIEKKSRFQ